MAVIFALAWMIVAPARAQEEPSPWDPPAEPIPEVEEGSPWDPASPSQAPVVVEPPPVEEPVVLPPAVEVPPDLSSFKADKVAERQRLLEELNSHVSRARWSGADSTYEKLVALGLPLEYRVHWLGVQAAETLGDPTRAYARVKRAIAVKPTEEAYEKEAELQVLYGAVDVRLATSYLGDRTLHIHEAPMEPAFRAVIEAATKAIAAEGRYEGFLPWGIYTIGTTEFQVVGEPLVEVRLK